MRMQPVSCVPQDWPCHIRTRIVVCRQTFQYFGLDFLVDAALHPWLMEVNATPSMKVRAAQWDTVVCRRQVKHVTGGA